MSPYAVAGVLLVAALLTAVVGALGEAVKVAAPPEEAPVPDEQPTLMRMEGAHMGSLRTLEVIVRAITSNGGTWAVKVWAESVSGRTLGGDWTASGYLSPSSIVTAVCAAVRAWEVQPPEERTWTSFRAACHYALTQLEQEPF